MALPTPMRALILLGRALGRLGQTQEACVTLDEFELRFPQTETVIDARSNRPGNSGFSMVPTW